MADLEDLAGPAKQPRGKADASAASDASAGSLEPKQMLSPPLRAALSKQGYKLVGAGLTHTTCDPCCLSWLSAILCYSLVAEPLN